MGRVGVGVYAEKLRKQKKKEPISPVVVLCTFDVFAKVKEKLTTRKMSSEILTSALLFLFLIISATYGGVHYMPRFSLALK